MSIILLWISNLMITSNIFYNIDHLEEFSFSFIVFFLFFLLVVPGFVSVSLPVFVMSGVVLHPHMCGVPWCNVAVWFGLVYCGGVCCHGGGGVCVCGCVRAVFVVAGDACGC